ncbi:MAG: hypothetical protein CSA58_06695 [Micrococcales bacterium]|nr:MAG: hypothetical protein CSB46_03710 [Micrococcales bacterium]PIE26979.1 MAG: hypothetical protein CSA58_06695 [Micrococcales bacterium]
MSARSGWYTDPHGGHDLYRFWNGHAWTEHTTNDPQQPVPAPGQATSSAQPYAAPPTENYDTTLPRVPDDAAAEANTASGAPAEATADWQVSDDAGRRAGLARALAEAPRRTGWLAGAALAAAIALVAGLFIANSAHDDAGQQNAESVRVYPTDSLSPSAATTPHPTICHAPTRTRTTRDSASTHVQAGGLSFPRLPQPWSHVQGEQWMSMSSDSAIQTAQIAEDSSGTAYAYVRSASIDTGSSNNDPHAAADMAAECILRTLYKNVMPGSTVVRNERFTVEGHEGWLQERNVTITYPDAAVPEERLIVLTVQVAPNRMAMYNATVATQAQDRLSQAHGLIAKLQVTS